MAFKPGVSGNPAGRPVGTGTAAKLRRAIESNADAILGVVETAALNGDLQACQFLLGRVIPPLKGVQPTTSLPHANSGDLTEQASGVVKSALNGDISADVASQLIGAISGLAKILETQDLIARIEALEQRNG